MPRTLEMPADLDAHGQHLWYEFMTTRERAFATQRNLRRLEPAMRQHSRRGVVSDPAIAARYHEARDAAEEADTARRLAEREYHAYRRVRFVRTRKRGQRQPSSAELLASADD